jgi:hypothetical protein
MSIDDVSSVHMILAPSPNGSIPTSPSCRRGGPARNDLKTRDETIGLETMCVGGGQGMAMLIERIS